jgi:hypothetical protein
MGKAVWSKPRLIDGNRYVQKIGEEVSICSNSKDSERYIDFVTLRTFSNTGDKLYEDEDSPIAGGIDVETAQSVIDQLTIAISILRGED